jgi:hypothetical protein
VSLRIVCSGHLVRYPLGGHSWHHLQYLVGLQRLGHEVTFFEHYGWPRSCYDPSRGVMDADPAYGVAYVQALLTPHGLDGRWSYLAEDGTTHGLSRAELAAALRDADLYLCLSGINWIPEVEACRRRALVDTDPVFTQIGAHGLAGPLDRYHVRFTYGENVHRPGCDMPTAGARWLPTRQPVVPELWPVTPGDPSAPWTSVLNWQGLGERQHEGRIYGGKPREFEPYFPLPRTAHVPMELAIAGAPAPVAARLREGGWTLRDAADVTRTPASFQDYLRRSRAEFGVAKHAYVTTRCGWFSDRSTGYLALGRPVVAQDTGFSASVPCGKGLLAFRLPAEALAAMEALDRDYDGHCRAARAVVEECFDASLVLDELLARAV